MDDHAPPPLPGPTVPALGPQGQGLTAAPTSAATGDGSHDDRRLRLRRPDRDQVVPVPAYLDALLPPDHLARLLWDAVARLDLRAFAADLVVAECGRGRAAADPALLVTP